MRSTWRDILMLAMIVAALCFLPACSSDDGDDPTDPGEPDDTTAPEVVGVSPSNGETDVNDDEDLVIQFSEDMDSTSDDGEITLSHGTIQAQTWTNARTLVVTHTDWSEGQQVTVTVGTGLADEAGNTMAAAFTATFFVETSEVRLLDTDPADGATDVNRDASVHLLFSEGMQDDSVENNVTIGDGAAEFAFDLIEGEEGQYVLDPVDRLPESTLITITVPVTVLADDGTPLAEAGTFSFTTGAEIDETPPTVLSFEPASGSVIPTDQGFVRITFSEPMSTGPFQPSGVNGQFMLLIDAADSEPSWNGEGTVLTVPLPALLPAGTPLEVEFDDFADANGVVQTTAVLWTATVTGSADYFPVADGAQTSFVGNWSRGDLGSTEPLEGGDAIEFLALEARPTAGEWNLWEFEDPDYTVPDEYEVLAVSAAGVDWLGFADEDEAKDLLENLFSDPLTMVEFPFVLDNTWSSSATLTQGEVVMTASLTGEVVGNADLPLFMIDDLDVYWSDVWEVTTSLAASIGGENFYTEERTAWYAAGIGLVKETLYEERLDPEDDPGWEESELWLMPFED